RPRSPVAAALPRPDRRAAKPRDRGHPLVPGGGGLMTTAVEPTFDGARVLITGGLGFIGSNLAIRLVAAGARVTLADAMIPEYGGNPFNIEPIRERVTVNFGDICDRHAMAWLVRGQDYVFHLAGQVSHVMSMTDPFPDIEYNVKGTAVVM